MWQSLADHLWEFFLAIYTLLLLMLIFVDFFRKCSILLESQAYLAPIQNDLIF